MLKQACFSQHHCTFKMTRWHEKRREKNKIKKIMKNIVRCASRNAHSARPETDGNFIAHAVRLIHRTIKRFLPAHYADRGAKIREWLLIGRRRELRPHGSASKALKIIGAVRSLAVGRVRPFIHRVNGFGLSSNLYLPFWLLFGRTYFYDRIEFHLQLWVNFNRELFFYILKFNM